MPKFKVDVEVTARCTYTVELEEQDEASAEASAIDLWRTKLPEDFQVEKGYIDNWEAEVEQLSWECEECGVEITREQSQLTGGLCSPCDAKMEAEDRSAQP